MHSLNRIYKDLSAVVTIRKMQYYTSRFTHHAPRSSFQSSPEGVHHTHGTGWVAARDDVATVTQPHQRVDIGLMGVSRERVDEKDQPSKIFKAHTCCDLSIPT